MGPSFPTELLLSSARPSELGLVVGRVPVAALAAEHCTPLIVYDEDHLRERCADVRRAFPDGAYAAKAFLCRSVADSFTKPVWASTLPVGESWPSPSAAGCPPAL